MPAMSKEKSSPVPFDSLPLENFFEMDTEEHLAPASELSIQLLRCSAGLDMPLGRERKNSSPTQQTANRILCTQFISPTRSATTTATTPPTLIGSVAATATTNSKPKCTHEYEKSARVHDKRMQSGHLEMANSGSHHNNDGQFKELISSKNSSGSGDGSNNIGVCEAKLKNISLNSYSVYLDQKQQQQQYKTHSPYQPQQHQQQNESKQLFRRSNFYDDKTAESQNQSDAQQSQQQQQQHQQQQQQHQQQQRFNLTNRNSSQKHNFSDMKTVSDHIHSQFQNNQQLNKDTCSMQKSPSQRKSIHVVVDKNDQNNDRTTTRVNQPIIMATMNSSNLKNDQIVNNNCVNDSIRKSGVNGHGGDNGNGDTVVPSTSPPAEKIIATTTTTTTTGSSTSSVKKSGPGNVSGKKTANDFVFGKHIGEGSFSNVYLAKDIHTKKEYAIKVCDKKHILREKKQEYIRREREALHIMSNVSGFVNLSCTFQDYRSLYFVMTYAKNGDLLPKINRAGCLNLECIRHYAAELVLAVENMHKRNVIHRDLKPENILLDERMHTLIADFGSAKILTPAMLESSSNSIEPNHNSDNDDSDSQTTVSSGRRKGSFVGTAQYVSPEVLKGEPVTKSSDLWALGCIIYQMSCGQPPFRGISDYLIFKEIMNLNLNFPDGFDANAKDLVKSLLKIVPEQRLGANDKSGKYDSIRGHVFFENTNFDEIRSIEPPKIDQSPSTTHCNDEDSSGGFFVPDNLEPGLNDKQITRLFGLELGGMGEDVIEMKTETTKNDLCNSSSSNSSNNSDAEKMKLLRNQMTDKWRQFVDDDEIIYKKGLIYKRKGLFARKRMLILTSKPRLIYIDPVQMIKMGEIPWSADLRVDVKNFKTFFVYTPNRTYYLEDPEGYALQWMKVIEDVQKGIYGTKS